MSLTSMSNAVKIALQAPKATAPAKPAALLLAAAPTSDTSTPPPTTAAPAAVADMKEVSILVVPETTSLEAKQETLRYNTIGPLMQRSGIVQHLVGYINF
jgi:hypothetical protein